jgi:hypothetical protein
MIALPLGIWRNVELQRNGTFPRLMRHSMKKKRKIFKRTLYAFRQVLGGNDLMLPTVAYPMSSTPLNVRL